MTATDFYFFLALPIEFLSIDDIKYFFSFLVLQTLKDNEVLWRSIHANDVHDFVLVHNLERQDLLANLAVSFIEFEHDLPFMNFSLPFGLKPRPQTLQMDCTRSARTFTGRYHRIWLIFVFFDVIF